MIEIKNISILELKFFNTVYQVHKIDENDFFLIKRRDLNPVEIKNTNKIQIKKEIEWLTKNMGLNESDYKTLNDFLK
jgi:hypothetical protein